MLHLEGEKKLEGPRTFAERQPSVYATRLTRQPQLVSTRRELDHFKASYAHNPTPGCVSLKCPTCSDLLAIEQLLGAGRPVALHPIYPFAAPEGSSRKAK